MAFDTTTAIITPLAAQEVVSITTASVQVAPQHRLKQFPGNLPEFFKVYTAQDGRVYGLTHQGGNTQAIPVGSATFDALIRQEGAKVNARLKDRDIKEINDDLTAYALLNSKKGFVWSRVAPIKGGIEIDFGDNSFKVIRITPGKVEVVTQGSETLFFRSATSKAFVEPAEKGDLLLLRKYLNMGFRDVLMMKAWLSYTLAHPKTDTSKYLMLALMGGQGSGKTVMCKNIIQPLIDPSVAGVQRLGTSTQDLAVALQYSHVTCFDNARTISHGMSDDLCTACTRGMIAQRKKYTDSDLYLIPLHGAVVLNGIHSVVNQADLAQRSLFITLDTIKPENRKTDAAINRELQEDMPKIFRGLLDLIAKVLQKLPEVHLEKAERMAEFSEWLAAMELADNAPEGSYGDFYAELIAEGQLDSLQGNPLAMAVISFANKGGADGWTGTATELLSLLSREVPMETTRRKDWPTTASAFSLALAKLESSLNTQGVFLDKHRGKERQISLMSTNPRDPEAVATNDDF